MAKKQKTDIKEKSVEALKNDVETARKELFTLQLDNQMRKLQNTRSIFLKRKEIARMLTAMTSKKAEGKKEVKNG